MDIENLTIRDMQSKLVTKEISALELTDEYIKKYGGSLVTVCADQARAAAQQAQEVIDSGKASSSPLCGIPIAVSDNICTKDTKTACGSNMLQNFIPPYNAHVCDRLIAQNAVIIGKSAVGEFGMSRGGISSEATIGDPAAGEAAVTLIPTYGRVSRFGLAAFASSFDRIGVKAKNASDCAVLLEAIAGQDSRDVMTKRPENQSAIFADTAGNATGLKIALMNGNDKTNEAAALFEQQGAVSDEYTIDIDKFSHSAYYIISSAELSSNMSRYDGIKFGTRAKEDGSFEKLVKASRTQGFSYELKKRILLGNFVLSNDNIGDYFYKAMAIRQQLKEEYTKLFEKYDLILTSSDMSAKLAGLPIIKINDIYVIGNYWEENKLLTINC